MKVCLNMANVRILFQSLWETQVQPILFMEWARSAYLEHQVMHGLGDGDVSRDLTVTLPSHASLPLSLSLSLPPSLLLSLSSTYTSSGFSKAQGVFVQVTPTQSHLALIPSHVSQPSTTLRVHSLLFFAWLCSYGRKKKKRKPQQPLKLVPRGQDKKERKKKKKKKKKKKGQATDVRAECVQKLWLPPLRGGHL